VTQRRRLYRLADRLTLSLPIILMGLLALGTYWLARNTPNMPSISAERTLTHDPDYFMKRFSIKTFDATGRLHTEIFGTEARHFPDTDTFEVDQPRIRSFNAQGVLTVATAKRAVSNGDGSQVQLIGDAVVTRESSPAHGGPAGPKMEIRGEFLHAFLQEERVLSNKPVQLSRESDRFEGDSLTYDNLARVLELKGRVRGVLQPGAPARH